MVLAPDLGEARASAVIQNDLKVRGHGQKSSPKAENGKEACWLDGSSPIVKVQGIYFERISGGTFVSVELLWTAEADQEMVVLERTPGDLEVRAVRRTLGRIESDPNEPRLGTRLFVTDGLGHVRATPTGTGDWYVLWQAGPTVGAVTILHVIELSI